MKEASQKSEDQNLPGMDEPISSPVSEGGSLPCDSQDGPKIDPSGQVLVRVNPSQLPVGAEALRTSAMFGPNSSDSSPSVNLQQSLESRLLQRLAGIGSLEYALTWKRWDMKSGPPICALRASTRRISDKDYSGWPTCQARDHKGGMAERAVNPARSNDLNDFSILAGWPTATTSDDNQNMEKRAIRGAKWGFGTALSLGTAARLAGWPTTLVNDELGSTHCYGKKKPGEKERKRFWKLPGAVVMTIGPTSISECVAMAKREGLRLNPSFSLWLMGFPAGWENYAEQGTPSSRKSPRSS